MMDAVVCATSEIDPLICGCRTILRRAIVDGIAIDAITVAVIEGDGSSSDVQK